MVVAAAVDVDGVLAGAEHLTEIGVTKLGAIIDLNRGARWVRAELQEAGLLEAAVFVEAEAHRDQHEHKNNSNYGDAHKDICRNHANITDTLLLRTVHILV